MSLSGRLFDAADWLSEDIPANTPLIQHLEGDVRLDELDLYCVALMREAAEFVLSTEARATAVPAGGGGDQEGLGSVGANAPSPTHDRSSEAVWRPMAEAPIDRVILLYGSLGHGATEAHPRGLIRVTGYWDAIDADWALVSTTWNGPFFKPLCWAELAPAPPPGFTPSGSSVGEVQRSETTEPNPKTHLDGRAGR